jgi:hypothetical protein
MYNVVWKTAIYFALSLLAHCPEPLIPLCWRMGDFGAANRHLWSEIVWPRFWAIQLWLVVLIFVYCAGRELIRAISRDKVTQKFFGSPVLKRA